MAPRGSAAPGLSTPSTSGLRAAEPGPCPARGQPQASAWHGTPRAGSYLLPAPSQLQVLRVPGWALPGRPPNTPNPAPSLAVPETQTRCGGAEPPAGAGNAGGGWPWQHPGEERPWPRLSPGSGICPAGPGQGKGPAGLGERSASAGTSSPAPCHGGGHGAVPSAGRVPRAVQWLAAAAMRLIASN